MIPLARAVVRPLLGSVNSFVTTEPVAALTFDDGPDPEATPRLLEVLGERGARGTFFMLGSMAARHPDIVRRVAESGHAIGIHSWDHSSMPSISARKRRSQLRACQESVSPHADRLFRPPFGHLSLGVRLDARLLGYETIMWNVSGDDWMGYDGERIAGKLLDEVRPGCIILLHDGLFNMGEPHMQSRESTLQAVDRFLRELEGRYRFLTIPELFRAGYARRTRI